MAVVRAPARLGALEEQRLWGALAAAGTVEAAGRAVMAVRPRLIAQLRPLLHLGCRCYQVYAATTG